MAASLLLLLTALSVRHISVVESKDCPVLATGSDQLWTHGQRLEWIPVATSMKEQLTGRPPGRSEVEFSVQSAASGLEVRLFSELHPGGYLLHMDRNGWRVQRTFVGTAHVTLASGLPPPDHITTSDDWSSYAVSVTDPGRLRLERLYNNGSRIIWLEVQDAEALPVDTVATRVVPPLTEMEGFGQGNRIGPVTAGDWGFWKFDCSQFYYQREELCHLWPSWPSDVPLRFRTLNLRISPVVNVNVLIKTTSTAELFLYETPERYYIITLTPSELTLGRAELGVPVPRKVARVCLKPAPGPPGFRLVWVSILRGFISIGLDEPAGAGKPCPEVTSPSAPARLADEVPATIGFVDFVFPKAAEKTTDDAPQLTLTGTPEVAELTTEVTEVTKVTEKEEVTTTTPSPGRTALITWQDGIAYSVLSYGVRTPEGQGVWTVDCQPSSASATDDGGDELPTRGIFDSLTPGGSSEETDSRGTDTTDDTSRRACQPSHPFLLATVVLSVISVVLLLVAVVLGSTLIGQRRRRSCELREDRRLSLAGTDMFGAPRTSGDHEYAEVHLYDSIRPMSVQQGESSFKPVRRQPTPVLESETKEDELPVFDERETSPGQLPPPPEDI